MRLEAADLREPLAARLARPPGEATRLYWLGQAGFVIEASGLRIVVDPYLSDALAAKYANSAFSHERMAPAPVDADGLGAVDFVLCTHQHTDHMDPGALSPLASRLPHLRFVVPAASLAVAQARIGVDATRLVGVDAGDEVGLGRGVSARVLRAAHETLERDPAGRHRYLGYVVNAPDARIYHSGDCVPFAGGIEEVRAARPDLALLPVNGRSESLYKAGFPGNFTAEEAVGLCEAADVPNLIAHHYGMFAFNTADPVLIDRVLENAPLRGERACYHTEYVLRGRL